jgi:hypothetical protein
MQVLIAIEMDTGKVKPVQRQIPPCPVCSYSLSEMEPRLFPFNSPVARPMCDGLGHSGALTQCAEASVAQPGERRCQGLGPAQRVLLFDVPISPNCPNNLTRPSQVIRQVVLYGSGAKKKRP